MSVSIVTLSRFPDIFRQFHDAVERYASDVRKILVRDGKEIEPPEGWTVLDGEQPFCFARNANAGIRAAGEDDVILSNDDAQFILPGTVKKLREIAEADPRIGLLSPQIDGRAMNPMQHAGRKLPQEPMFTEQPIAFVCVYIPRRTIEAVGWLDEQFEDGAFEDTDYCLRVRKAGLELAVTSLATVAHGFGGTGSTSIYRRFGGYRPLIEKNAPRFNAKWPK